MRAYSLRFLRAGLALAGLLTAFSLASSNARAADETDMSGFWKLIQVRIVDAEILTLDVKQDGAKIAAFIAEPAQLRDNQVKAFERKGDSVRLALSVSGNEFTFTGKVGKDNKVLGTIIAGLQVVPARLVKTDDKILAKPVPPQEFFQAYNAIEQAKDAKAKADKLAELLHKEAGDAKYSMFYGELLRFAALAGEPAEKVRKYADEWIKGAEPYGTEWSSIVRAQALKILSDKKPYAELALELADQADKQLGEDSPLELRAEIAASIVSAAKLAGKFEILEKAEAKSKKLEIELDEDYHKKVPPFKPEVSEGRKDKGGDRVVLLELFTGAQCPPCVAADVAFDALSSTYKPTEVIALQYHLHIPGPDPLTNPSTLERQEYYPDLRGTPAAYFNGRQNPGGGGGMAQSKAKYDEYREVIENILDKKKRAKVDLHVERSGDEIKITASAQAKKDDKDSESAGKNGIKLRLVVTEEQIKYTGSNRLRFHHHVVRAMPGGSAGKTLSDGEGKVEVSLKLSELRQELDTYLDDFTKKGAGFSSPRPPIDLKKLTVVAFLQDDSDKSVLDAVSVPVAEAKGEEKAGE